MVDKTLCEITITEFYHAHPGNFQDTFLYIENNTFN